MAGNTVAELNTNLTSMIDELTILTASIKDSHTSAVFTSSNKGDKLNTSVKKDIREFKDEADSYDRRFEEEESRLQAFGGKTRKQTLQEFVLLFFFVAYGILTIAFVLYANRVGLDTKKILAAMIFILLVLTAIIVTYA